jgi:ATP-dependent DNA helicase RecQ
MKDQVDALSSRGIAATFIDSTLGEAERVSRAAAIGEGRFRLAYVSPERFRSPRFMEALTRVRLSLFAVDEAHCISQWGHDFRPEYARLGEVRVRLGSPRTLALTATATPAVRGDICRALSLVEPSVFVSGFDRPNLFLEVVRVSSDRDRARCVSALASRGGAGIVYVATRRAAEKMAAALSAAGRPALRYHGGLAPWERRQAQETFMARPGAIIVATNAFGMGVDRSDLRFVVHAETPRTLEAYYQEVGRAGRDGFPAHAALLFNHADVFMHERMIAASHPDPLLVKDLWDLLRAPEADADSVPRLASALGVGDRSIHAALGLLEREGHIARLGLGGSARVSLLAPGGAALLPERAAAQRAALRAVAEVAGASSPRDVPVEDLARRAGLAEATLRRALFALADEGLIAYRPPERGRVIRPVDPSLTRDELRVDFALVQKLALGEKTMLRAMSAYAYSKGCRRRHLLGYFGERAPFRCSACDVCRGRTVVASRRVRERSPRESALPRQALRVRGASREATRALFEEGRNVEEIARLRLLTEETIRGHLAELIELGLPVPVSRIVPPERQELIQEAIDAHARSLDSIKRALPPDVLLGEIRVVAAAQRARAGSQDGASSKPVGCGDGGTKECQRQMAGAKGEGAAEERRVPQEPERQAVEELREERCDLDLLTRKEPRGDPGWPVRDAQTKGLGVDGLE